MNTATIIETLNRSMGVDSNNLMMKRKTLKHTSAEGGIVIDYSPDETLVP